MSTIELLEHFPYSAHPETKATARLRGFGTPGESVVFSFSMRSKEALAEIEISTSSLQCDKQSIASTHIEVYVVKRWDVSGVGIHQSMRMSAGELLLKDDRAPLVDGYLEHPLHGVGSARPLWYYRPPCLRLTGNASTSLDADEHKQIWLSVKIPVETPASAYSGFVTIANSGGQPQQLALELKVLPFTLREPTQDLMVWYRGSMDPEQSQFYVSQELFRIHLQDIYDHGFRSISVNERDCAKAQLAIDIAEEVGFDRHIVFRLMPENAAALRFRKLKPVYYLSDEIDAHMQRSRGLTESYISEHRAHGAYCQYLKWASMASIVDRSFVARMADEEDVGYRPDIVSVDVDNNKESFTTSCDSEQPLTYYYWHSHMEKPNLHRVLAGVYLWKSGADGATPYCYQHPPVFPFSPYDDFDAWEPGCRDPVLTGPYLWEPGVDGVSPFRHQAQPGFPLSALAGLSPRELDGHAGLARDQMTTYPADAGVIPTLQWQGLREGIIDLRYLTTLDHALSLIDSLATAESKALAAEARYNRDLFLSRVSITEITINSDNDLEPYAQIPAHEYHIFRRQIASDIERLYTLACA